MKRLLLIIFIVSLTYSCSEVKVSSNVFNNDKHGLTFRYTSNWTKAQPQLESTLCLLYEHKIHASCNVSFIKAERNKVEKYNEDYMSRIANKAFNNVNNLNVKFETLTGRKFSICTFNFEYPKMIDNVSDFIFGKGVIYTTNSNGNRYMMVYTVPVENYDLLKNEIFTMANTFVIINR